MWVEHWAGISSALTFQASPNFPFFPEVKKVRVNSLNAKVAIIWKPVNWFDLALDKLI